MATVDGITPVRAQEIEDNSFVAAAVVDGELLLTKGDGITVVNVGIVNNAAALGLHEEDPTTHGIATGEIVGTVKAQTLTSKTLTTPTIGSFINAGHTHGDSVGGGALVIGVASSPAPVTTLTLRTLLDADAGVPKSLASFTVTPGRWLILATCEGVNLNTATKTRFSFDLTSSQSTFVSKPVASSADTVALDGGASINGWLENTVSALITFTITKNGTGAQVSNTAVGSLIAIRMG
jgi:hypothetical protein